MGLQGGNLHTLETSILRKSSQNPNILWKLQDEEKHEISHLKHSDLVEILIVLSGV